MEELKKAEEAAEKYAIKTMKIVSNGMFDNVGRAEGFIAGAKWDRELMMKGVVDATIMASKCGDKYQQLLITDWNRSDGLHNGDKVKVIIVKED